MSEAKDRFDRNIARAQNLLDIYENKLAGTGQGRRPLSATDLLRAAVVFLHASLEDYLRAIAQARLPEGHEAILDNVPLVGISDVGRPVKFFLGALAKHSAKTVRKVLAESVKEHLQRLSFNRTADIAAHLQRINVNPDSVKGWFRDLDQLISRRHSIVHEADRNPRRGRGHYAARDIGRDTVRRWIQAVEEFVEAVEAAL